MTAPIQERWLGAFISWPAVLRAKEGRRLVRATSRRAWIALAASAAAFAATVATLTPSSLAADEASTCSMYFVASVRQGPLAGTNYEGLLTLRLDAHGRVRGGSFDLLDGQRVEIAAKSHDGVVKLTIRTADGKLTGKGPIVADLGLCLGTMEGSLKGPRPHSRGDWLAASSQTIQLSGGALLMSSPTSHVLYRLPFGSPAVVFAGVLNAPGNVDGPRLSARFNMPSGIDQDAVRSLIYIADVGNAAIRRINQSTGQVSTILRAGDAVTAAAAAGFSVTGWEPHGVGVDNVGNLFISDPRNQVVWYYNATTLRLRLLAGLPGSPGLRDGVGTAARFNGPDTIAMSPDRTVANLVDTVTCVVRQVTKTGQVATIGSTLGCG